jgi:type IV pilus assembly protein PilX
MHRLASMPSSLRCAGTHQRGIVLITSLLLLLVVTIMALSMFRSFGLQEKIAGNVREKQRALQIAMSTEEYAEWWLVNESNATFALANGDATAVDVTCTNPSSLQLVTNPLSTSAGGQICSNTTGLTTVLGAPSVTKWPAPSATAGVGYQPPNMNFTNNAAANYYPTTQEPRFYIQDLGANAAGTGEIYQIDAYGFGLSSTGVALVESTFEITSLTSNHGLP